MIRFAIKPYYAFLLGPRDRCPQRLTDTVDVTMGDKYLDQVFEIFTVYKQLKTRKICFIDKRTRESLTGCYLKLTGAIREASDDIHVRLREAFDKLDDTNTVGQLSDIVKEFFSDDMTVRLIDDFLNRTLLINGLMTSKNKNEREIYKFDYDFDSTIDCTLDLITKRDVETGIDLQSDGELKRNIDLLKRKYGLKLDENKPTALLKGLVKLKSNQRKHKIKQLPELIESCLDISLTTYNMSVFDVFSTFIPLLYIFISVRLTEEYTDCLSNIIHTFVLNQLYSQPVAKGHKLYDSREILCNYLNIHSFRRNMVRRATPHNLSRFITKRRPSIPLEGGTSRPAQSVVDMYINRNKHGFLETVFAPTVDETFQPLLNELELPHDTITSLHSTLYLEAFYEMSGVDVKTFLYFETFCFLSNYICLNSANMEEAQKKLLLRYNRFKRLAFDIIDQFADLDMKGENRVMEKADTNTFINIFESEIVLQIFSLIKRS